MAPLTVVELRRLARLFREGVDGAADRLEAIVRERGEELAELLRFPRANLARVAEAADVAQLVAATIEGSGRLRREAIRRSQRSSATGLAETLCRVSHRRDDGSIELHGPLLAEILLLWGTGYLVFGDWGSVEAERMRAILRQCRGVIARSVILTPQALFVFYETSRSRGVIRLHLQRVVLDADALRVPIEQIPNQPVDTPEPAPPLAEDAPMEPPLVARPRVRRGFVSALVEVAIATVLGGGP